MKIEKTFILIAAFVLGILIGYITKEYKINQVIQNIDRQYSGELNQKELELQKQEQNLNKVKSDLVHTKELNKIIEDSLKNKISYIRDINEKYESKIKSYSYIVSSLNQKIINKGKTDVQEVDSTKTKYGFKIEHSDGSIRLKIEDENIFEEGDEKVFLNQTFKIDAIIQEQDDGILETQQMFLREIDPVTKEVIAESELDTEESFFVYKFDRGKIINSGPRFPIGFIFSYDSKSSVGLGIEFLSINDFGINSRYNFNEDPRLSLGASYRINVLDLKTNFSLGGSLSTPIDDIGDKYIGTGEIIFYLNRRR
jgi:hypothetical protein